VEESLSTPNDAEVKILRGLLLRPELLVQVIDLLHPEDFFQERHRLIYTAMLSLSQEHSPISVQTACEVLEQRGSLDSVGGSEYLTALGNPIDEQELMEHAASLHRRASARRHLLSAGKRIQQLAREEPDETIAFEKATQLLAAVKRNPVTVASPLAEFPVESMQELSQVRTQSDEWTGVPTGFVDLDRLIDGLQPSDSSDTCGSSALTSAAMAAFDRLDTTVRGAVASLLACCLKRASNRLTFPALVWSRPSLYHCQALRSLLSNINRVRTQSIATSIYSKR
jgi:replicative DNA helicase